MINVKHRVEITYHCFWYHKG